MVFGTMEILMGVSMSVAAFFMKAFYNRLNDAVNSINDLNKNVAVAINNQNHITSRVEKLESETERVWKSNEKVRESLHDMRNELGQVKLNKFEIENLKRAAS